MLSEVQLAILKMAVDDHICRQTRILFGRTHLHTERNACASFSLNSSSGFGGDAITVLTAIFVDELDFGGGGGGTTRPLGEHPI